MGGSNLHCAYQLGKREAIERQLHSGYPEQKRGKEVGGARGGSLGLWSRPPDGFPRRVDIHPILY